MSNRWGPEGPPPEAYSRVSRDLGQVFEGFHLTADALVQRLVRTYDATARPATDEEARRFRHTMSRATMVTPAASGASSLVVAWASMKSCPVVLVEAGDWISAVLPACSCDACDTDLEDVTDELERLVFGVVGGFAERVERIELGRRIKVSHQLRESGGAFALTRREARDRGISPRRGAHVWASWSLRSGAAATT